MTIIVGYLFLKKICTILVSVMMNFLSMIKAIMIIFLMIVKFIFLIENDYCYDDNDYDYYYDDYSNNDDYDDDHDCLCYKRPLNYFKRLLSHKNNVGNWIDNVDYNHEISLLADNYRVCIC